MGSRTTTSFKIIHFPKIMNANPYMELFYRSLSSRSIESEFGQSFSPSRIRQLSKYADAVHVQWIEYTINRKSGFAGLLRVWDFITTVKTIKHSKLSLIWTCHNLIPHHRANLKDRFLSQYFAKQADLIICHSLDVKGSLVRMGALQERVLIVKHPSYTGYYPDLITREKARKVLGFEAREVVYLFLGLLKPYKGIEDLITAFRSLPDPNAVLLIAGKDFSNAYAVKVLAPLVKEDKRIKLHEKFLSNEELEIYCKASDILVYPFQKIDTSGSMMLPFTYPKRVIVRDLPFSRGLFNERMAVFFKDVPGLVQAFHDVWLLDDKKARQEFEGKDAELSWDKLMAPVADRILSLRNR